MLARWIGAPMEEITYICAGINHQAWYLEYKWNGKDAYPLIRKAVTNATKIYNEEQVRNEMFLALGYYVTESSGHNSEYNWWFRKRPGPDREVLHARHRLEPGRLRRILKRVRATRERLAGAGAPLVRRAARPGAGQRVRRVHHQRALGGEPFQFNGNVANTGLITNLPTGACVEVPVWASKNGFEAVQVGALPASVAMLTRLNSDIEEMAVEGALAGDPTRVYQAIAHDPLTASVLSLREIRQMVNEMFAANRDHLPTFEHYEA